MSAEIYSRTYPLDGIDIIRRGQGGDGRIVEAYCAVFETPTEVRDAHGHYREIISRSAFDDTLRRGIDRVKCFYNHGAGLDGRPSDRWSVPIGTPIEIRADGRGLRTITRFNSGPDADQILEAIRNEAITGYSFRGAIRESNPSRVPRSIGDSLPTITRTRLGLTEYGPCPSPYYSDAKVLAVRSDVFGDVPENVLVRYESEPETRSANYLEDIPPSGQTRALWWSQSLAGKPLPF